MHEDHPFRKNPANDEDNTSGQKQAADESKPVPDNFSQRYKRITDKLYECLVVDSICRYRFSFGMKKYCSWMLRNDQDRAQQLPCCQDPPEDPNE